MARVLPVKIVKFTHILLTGQGKVCDFEMRATHHAQQNASGFGLVSTTRFEGFKVFNYPVMDKNFRSITYRHTQDNL